MNAEIVSKSLVIDDVPMEKVEFQSGSRVLRMSLEKEGGIPVVLVFRKVASFRFVPSVMYDRRNLFVEGEYIRSVLAIKGSEWLSDLLCQAAESSEPISHELCHFVVPSDEGVWEILAGSFTEDSS
jgi:hypothetical protein